MSREYHIGVNKTLTTPRSQTKNQLLSVLISPKESNIIEYSGLRKTDSSKASPGLSIALLSKLDPTLLTRKGVDNSSKASLFSFGNHN